MCTEHTTFHKVNTGLVVSVHLVEKLGNASTRSPPIPSRSPPPILPRGHTVVLRVCHPSRLERGGTLGLTAGQRPHTLARAVTMRTLLI